MPGRGNWRAAARCRTADAEGLFVRGARQREARELLPDVSGAHGVPRARVGPPGRVRGVGRDDRAAAPRAAAGPAGRAVVGGAAVRGAPGARRQSSRATLAWPSGGRRDRPARSPVSRHRAQGRPAGSGSSTGTSGDVGPSAASRVPISRRPSRSATSPATAGTCVTATVGCAREKRASSRSSRAARSTRSACSRSTAAASGAPGSSSAASRARVADSGGEHRVGAVEHQPGQRHVLGAQAGRRSRPPRAARPAPARRSRRRPCPASAAARRWRWPVPGSRRTSCRTPARTPTRRRASGRRGSSTRPW